MHFRVFSEGQGTEWGTLFGVVKFFFFGGGGCLEFLNILFR